jgi:hypothetical protein
LKNSSLDDILGVPKVTVSHLDNINDFIKRNKSFDDVADDYAKAYVEDVSSNKRGGRG